MADTQRSLSDLLSTLFQDGQPINSISPQDMRDLIVSLGQASMGEIAMDGNATETAIAAVGTYYELAGTFAAGVSSSDITITGNEIKYTGLVDKRFVCFANVSMLSAGNNILAAFKFMKNGTAFGTPIHRFVGTGADQGALAVMAVTTLSTNDTIKLSVANDTNTSNITGADVFMMVHGSIL